MTKTILLALVVALTGCKQASPTDTVESLLANPARLDNLRQQCSLDQAKVGDELCARVSEATRRQFFGNGKAAYTPPTSAPKF